ncbi:SLAM family member 5-like isoform X2 [Clarias gariepinus]|uniref:SLAM family member 5-like isoform X2 n=1 Tax=Clarias gariepinus TaxID=13013 RepID=UPI00234DC4EB|nr:SLAM family member 5-like isoform X2 [Clarias gariepinus]
MMKILPGNRILWTFLLLLCCLLCAAGDETVTLQEVEGTTITLHTGITGIQSDAHIVWFYGPEKAEEKILNSQVFKGETVTEISERFKERLQLDRISGALTIRNISRNHSGVYLLHVIAGRLSSKTFSVSVYEECFPLCTVENGEDVTLSWYRGTERLNITNNTDLSVNLSLTLQIHNQDINTNTYTCVSANPVSNKTTSLSITQLCDHHPDKKRERSRFLLPVVISVGGLILILVILSPLFIQRIKEKQQVSDKSEDLTYSDVKRVKAEENWSVTCVEENGSVVYSEVKRS